LLPLILLVAPNGCGHAGLPTVSMQIGGTPFTLEMATTPSEQITGLMHRDHLDPDKGMIFIFPNIALQNFWNHDVSFPLDLIFLDQNGKVVSIKRMEKFSDLNISSDVPAKYAIELNAGTAAEVGIKTGDLLSIPSQAAGAAGR